MTVDVELYRSTTQFSRRVVTFDRRGEAWEPSEHSVLEEMDVPPTTEAVDAEGGDAVAEDGAEPGERGRRGVAQGDEAGGRG